MKKAESQGHFKLTELFAKENEMKIENVRKVIIKTDGVILHKNHISVIFTLKVLVRWQRCSHTVNGLSNSP